MDLWVHREYGPFVIGNMDLWVHRIMDLLAGVQREYWLGFKYWLGFIGNMDLLAAAIRLISYALRSNIRWLVSFRQFMGHKDRAVLTSTYCTSTPSRAWNCKVLTASPRAAAAPPGHCGNAMAIGLSQIQEPKTVGIETGHPT
jgi:hypothetical protein